MQENAARLKAYKAKLVLFPARSKKPKSGDAMAEETKVVQQHKGPLLPLVHETPKLETIKLTDELKVNVTAYLIASENLAPLDLAIWEFVKVVCLRDWICKAESSC